MSLELLNAITGSEPGWSWGGTDPSMPGRRNSASFAVAVSRTKLEGRQPSAQAVARFRELD
jgi:hypothetical protein